MIYTAWHGYCNSVFDRNQKQSGLMEGKRKNEGDERKKKKYDFSDRSFMKQKRKELSIPDAVYITALRHLFSKKFGDVQVERTPIYIDKEKGIDFYVKTPQGKEIGVDTKARVTNNKLLTLEVDWLNTNRQAWLYKTQADYFLFVHESAEKTGYDCYLVSVEDARRLAKEVPPRSRRGWRDPGVEVAIIYFYEYNDLARIGAIAERVFVKV